MNFNKILILALIFSVVIWVGGASGRVSEDLIPDDQYDGTLIVDINPKLGESWFSFILLSDLHIGEGYRDYGSPGYNDHPPRGDIGYSAQRLRKAVTWINANKDKYRIKFVVVTGDITNSGERSEFLKAKEILDSLRIPYIPVIGNHDIWPHTSSSESKYPTGDRYFKKVFANNFKKLKALFPGWNDGTRNRAIWNGECDSLIRKDAGCYSYFQNFAFDYAGYHFIFADFVGRDHAIFGYKGAMPDADLSDSKKVRGTWSWFKNHLKKYPNKGSDNVLIFAHHPLTKYDAGVMTFSSKEYNAVTSYLNKYKYSVGGWFAGHFHYNRVYNIKTWWWSTVSPGHETAVLKESPKSGPGGDKGGKVLHREFNSKIVRVWGKSQDSNPSGVTFYEHTWYRGRKEVFVADDPDLRNNYIGNDKISSLRIGSCKVTLYEHKNYRGKSITFTKDVPDLTKYIAKKSWWRKTTWNDLTSSVKVVC